MTNKRTHAYLKYDFINKTIKLPEKHEEQKTERQKTGIIYARVSTDEQKIRGNGISAQIIDCETWAKRNNVKIMHDPFVDEGISGTKLNRKGFIDAIEYIEKMNKDHPTIDYFICNSTSRFSRSHNLSDTFDMVGRVNSAGAQLVAVGNGGIQDMDSDAGFLNFGLNSLMDAVESKRGQKRVRYGVTGKIMSGYRPFGHVPVGYDRITIKEGGQELKILVVDEEKAPIIKSGLELFADGVLLTKHDLFEYFHERGLKSNSKINKTGELHPSIIDRMLDVWKLFVYAGYITYPKRGINEIIPAKHTPLIDMNTVDKIMIRLKKYKGIDHEKRAYDQDIDDYPLKRLLLCPECDKAVTKWKSRSHTGAYHHYYGCNTKGCKLYKKGLPRDKVHESVIKKLQEITPSRNIEKFFDAIFKEERNTEKLDMKNANKTKEKELAKLKEERDKIEIILNNITDPKLFKKKEEHRAEINQKIEDVEYSMRDITFEKSEFQRNLNDAKTILFNPTAMWKFGDAEIKQLLIGVCFNNKIYYKKNQGCRTPEISPIYGYLASLGDKKTPNPEDQGFEPWLHKSANTYSKRAPSTTRPIFHIKTSKSKIRIILPNSTKFYFPGKRNNFKYHNSRLNFNYLLMDFSILLNKKIGILGFGKEGKSTLNFLLRHNIKPENITILDGKNIDNLPEGINYQTGENYLKNLNDYNLIFKSAGIPYYPEIQAIQDKVVTQVQFFFDHYEGKVIALTASKGKTTMTALTHHLLQTAGYDTKLVGNIGTAVLDEIDFETKHDFVVIELSSFMLETLKKKNFCSILGAIFPVHLDRHGNMGNYTKAKFNIINGSEHTIIYEKTLNDYNLIERFSNSDLIPYGTESEYTRDGVCFYSKGRPVFPLSDINLIGEHNLQNISAIVALADLLQIPATTLQKAIQTFEAVRHRLQLVGNFKGIDFYDDAIATTPDSTMAAMNAIGDKLETIFLGGIEGFWFDFPALVEKIKKSQIKNIVFFPDSGEKIAEMLGEEGYTTLHTRDMKEAVKFAYEHTSKGKTCLLSTASPSFSCRKNFEEKGDLFQQYVIEFGKE